MPAQHALIIDRYGNAGTRDVPGRHALNIFELDLKGPLDRTKAQQETAAEEAQQQELSGSTKQSEQVRKRAETGPCGRRALRKKSIPAIYHQ